MHPDLKIRRRVFVCAMRDYTLADQRWHEGLEDAAQFVPDVVVHGCWQIGNPGSRIRRLYDERDRALQRVVVSRLKLKTAQARIVQADIQPTI